MITIHILGLDQYVVGHYSKENTANLAQLYESDPELLNFHAPNTMVFHEGVEQTSWNTIVIVRAPKKYKVVEAQVADYLLKTLNEFSMNLEIEFEYFEEDSRYEYINGKYPRYIGEDNVHVHEFNFDGEEGEEVPLEHIHDHDHAHEEEEEEDSLDGIDITDPDQIYLGNAFEGFEERLSESKKK